MNPLNDYPGRITIGRIHPATAPEPIIRIQLRSAAWSRPVTVDLTPDQFTRVLMGGEDVDCLILVEAQPE